MKNIFLLLFALSSFGVKATGTVFSVERNVLLNPAHPDFAKIRIVGVEPVRWDDRLFEEPS